MMGCAGELCSNSKPCASWALDAHDGSSAFQWNVSFGVSPVPPTFLAAKHADTRPRDPVEDLRAGWDLSVEFGLANPELYALMYGEPRRGTSSAAFQAGMQILLRRIHRLATSGWLRVDEELAASLIHATARGAVLTWLSLPDDRRDSALLTTMREAMVSAVTLDKPAVRDAGPAGAARALRAVLPEQTTLSSGEQHLLGEWLDRLIADG
jgi:hypothetical protein